MLNSPLKMLLFIVGGLVAVAAGAYYIDDRGKRSAADAPMVAALPDGSTAPTPSAAVPAVGGPAAAQPQAPGNEEILAPTFDLLRVEPDGSMVIAGRSAPKAGIEVVVGSNVIAKATANADREFVVVLDEPLKPGDYQIVLRSTSPDNVVATSLETALVSVPDSESGEVLALVEEPGKASRLITVPEGETPAADDSAPAEVAAAPAEAPAPVPAADARTAPATAQTAAAETADAQPAVADATPPATPTDAPRADAAPAGDTAPATAAADAPAGEAAAAAEAPPVAGEAVATAEAPATDAAPAADTAGETKPAEGEAKVAMVDPAATPGPAKAPEPTGAERPAVRVEAVEIEGRSVFVAGMASPGLVVRVYANAILLGEAPSSDAGRFLIETERDLPVGDYIVRADLLADGGRKVVARAAVPFQREEGESIAAIAAPPPAAAAPQAAAEPTARPAASEPAAQPTAEKPAGQPAGETVAAAAEPATDAAPQVAAASEPTARPAASEPAAQPTAEKPAGQPAGGTVAAAEAAPPPVETQPEAPAAAEPVAEPAAPPPAASEPAAQPTAEKPAGEAVAAAVETAPQPVETKPEAPAAAEPATDAAPQVSAGEPTAQPAASEPAAQPTAEKPTGQPVGETVAAATAEPATDDVVTVTSAPLQAVDSAVIIRRGDTLWRISRRVYGRGVRYSTIYLANQEQIEDPDRIWPGQVFRVPDKTTEGESADLDAMGAQVTTVEPAATAR